MRATPQPWPISYRAGEFPVSKKRWYRSTRRRRVMRSLPGTKSRDHGAGYQGLVPLPRCKTTDKNVKYVAGLDKRTRRTRHPRLFMASATSSAWPTRPHHKVLVVGFAL